ncbi:type III polyketide synthase [Neobacillus sp. MM2021_6]|uniref:type III polyketide synthase n=1 Tax=Bacillaceae TaxID=186817 RepID=UPI00140A17EA|nr:MULTISPECIES: 3-oxoacyl-[acyl-carrier-protein] synthase III C-terminal domain-containing protein [Bacillaceae]MBO0958219.1 type III polyketide synthase [Neobacillus sp. MM2021_6]NHC17818.1 type III polyketide synthase [Bacillus sp. MM2020_4]
MPAIISISEVSPPFEITQNDATEFARELFADSFKDIDRLLKAFQNGQIEKRHFVKDLEWFKANRSIEERNNAYIECAVELGKEAIMACLNNQNFLIKNIPFEEIDAIFFISSTGISTPSIDARIMNQLSFNPHTKRVPIWGLGCAGGAAGLTRAFEYCLAFPKAKVIVLSVELCSLTFQKNDLSKSNLIGTSLFADGVACALVCGDEAKAVGGFRKAASPEIIATQSTLMPDSLDVMGWELKNTGLFVVFSRDIPHIVEGWLKPNVMGFLAKHQIELDQIDYFIAHPGGKKVLDAYVMALNISPSMNDISLEVLKQFGNMSSATILFVLKRYMEMAVPKNKIGLATALGPGFSSELLLLRWN